MLTTRRRLARTMWSRARASPCAIALANRFSSSAVSSAVSLMSRRYVSSGFCTAADGLRRGDGMGGADPWSDGDGGERDGHETAGICRRAAVPEASGTGETIGGRARQLHKLGGQGVRHRLERICRPSGSCGAATCGWSGRCPGRSPGRGTQGAPFRRASPDRGPAVPSQRRGSPAYCRRRRP